MLKLELLLSGLVKHSFTWARGEELLRSCFKWASYCWRDSWRLRSSSSGNGILCKERKVQVKSKFTTSGQCEVESASSLQVGLSLSIEQTLQIGVFGVRGVVWPMKDSRHVRYEDVDLDPILILVGKLPIVPCPLFAARFEVLVHEFLVKASLEHVAETRELICPVNKASASVLLKVSLVKHKSTIKKPVYQGEVVPKSLQFGFQVDTATRLGSLMKGS